MKTHEITTSKGEFVAVDLPIEELFTQDKIIKAFIDSNKLIEKELGNDFDLKLICKLSEATEDDAKLIVDEFKQDVNNNVTFYNYKLNIFDLSFSSLDSLQSLLKSKGIDINNGNWYLFKKL